MTSFSSVHPNHLISSLLLKHLIQNGLDSSAGKESVCNAGDPSSVSGSGRSPEEGTGYLLQYSCLENPQGQRSLAGYNPWGFKESDMTERLSTYIKREKLELKLSVY